MSYPWWRFVVTFADGFSTTWHYTELGPTYAMLGLLEEFVAGTNSTMQEEVDAHGDIVAIRYLHCDTYGVDEASDAILEAEGA